MTNWHRVRWHGIMILLLFLLVFDHFFTDLAVKIGYGREINPLVLLLGFNFSFFLRYILFTIDYWKVLETKSTRLFVWITYISLVVYIYQLTVHISLYLNYTGQG